jgi:Uma2 family endonuclease
MYAEAGIREVGLVYLMGDCIEVYLQPENGMYKECVRFERGDFLTPLQLPDISLSIDSILG